MQIQEAAYQFQQAIEADREIVVGVNRFQTEEPPAKDLLRVNEAAQEAQIASVQAVRARRDNERAAELLQQIENAQAARGAVDAPLRRGRAGATSPWARSVACCAPCSGNISPRSCSSPRRRALAGGERAPAAGQAALAAGERTDRAVARWQSGARLPAR